MFKKLVSALPFSPSLIAQLGFYAARLKKEQWLRRLGLIFTVFALVIQSFAVFSPPESANAANSTDMIYGGVKHCEGYTNVTCGAGRIIHAYDTNENGYKELLDAMHITWNDLHTLKIVQICDRNNWISFGHGPRVGGELTWQQSAGVRDFQMRTPAFYGLNCLYAYVGTSSWNGQFGFVQSCGNLILRQVPPKACTVPGKTHLKQDDPGCYNPCPYNPNVTLEDPRCEAPKATCTNLRAAPTTGKANETDFTFGVAGDISGYNAVWTGYRYNWSGAANGTTGDKPIQPNAITDETLKFSAPGQYKVQGFLNTNNAGNGITSAACIKTITVNPQLIPNYTFTKEADKTELNPDGTVNYTLTFKNTGNMTLTDVVIKDVLPGGLTYVSGSGYIGTVILGDNTGKGNAHKLSTAESSALLGSGLKIGSVGTNTTITIRYTAKAPARTALKCGPSTFTNKASATAKEKPNGASDEKTITVNRSCTPQYDLAKSANKTTAKPGDTINYTLTFKNTGNMDLSNVVVSDKIDGAAYTLATAPKASAAASGDLFNGGMKFATVKEGDTITITYSLKVKAFGQLSCGANKIPNAASVTTDQKKDAGNADETNQDNNAWDVVVTAVCDFEHDLAKKADKTVAKPGEVVNYTLTFTNTGNRDLTNVVIKDNLTASGMEFVKGSVKVDPATGAANTDKLFSTGLTVAKVASGKSVKITYQAKAPAADKLAKCGDNLFKNHAVATAKSELGKTIDESVTTNNDQTVKVSRTCSFDLAKKASKTTANPGDTINYTLTFKNTGNSTLTNVVIKDVLPKNVTYQKNIKVSPATGVTDAAKIFDTGLKIAKVQANATITITYSVKVAPSQAFQCGPNALKNVASATAKEAKESNLNNNETTTNVTGPCDCARDENAKNESCIMRKYAINNTQGGSDATTTAANGGDSITYTITYSNTTDATQTIDINDSLVDVLDYANLTDNGGGTFDENAKMLTWGRVAIESGKSVSRSFTVTIKNPVPAMAESQTAPGSFDCKIDNSALIGDGKDNKSTNVVSVNINCPAPKIIEQTVQNLPATGAGTNLIFGGIVAALVVFFYARSRQLGKEVRLVRKEYAAGTL